MEIEKELNNLGLINFKKVYRNLSVCKLVEHSILRGEGNLTSSGALNINTGKYTGRSPKDRFIVDTKEIHNDINWEIQILELARRILKDYMQDCWHIFKTKIYMYLMVLLVLIKDIPCQ